MDGRIRCDGTGVDMGSVTASFVLFAFVLCKATVLGAMSTRNVSQY